jgi:hypothetical protein
MKTEFRRIFLFLAGALIRKREPERLKIDIELLFSSVIISY